MYQMLAGTALVLLCIASSMLPAHHGARAHAAPVDYSFPVNEAVGL